MINRFLQMIFLRNELKLISLYFFLFYCMHSGNMRSINNLRARLIHSELKSDDCAIVTMAIRTLQNIPSYSESTSCRSKGCISRKKETIFPVIKLNGDVFENKWENLEEAIVANFDSDAICPKCRRMADNFLRKLGEHLIIEVIFSRSSKQI